MHPFASYVLRCYYRATGWNDDNLYANLTRSSNAILDFSVPRGLHLSVSQSPNALFRTSYSMNAMPSLNGSVGYIFTSCPLDVKTSGTVPFKSMIDHFKVYDQPRRLEGPAGSSVNLRDYLLYGRLYLPTGRLDALYSTRLSSTMQLLVAAISDPASNGFTDLRPRKADSSNVMLSLQHDIGKWCTEYTWSAEDGMCGVKVLHNFGKTGEEAEKNANVSAVTAETRGEAGIKRVDEEDPVEGGLRGRVSAGAELYFSAKEKSAGVSTGIRFTTLPDAAPLSFQNPPSTSSPLAMASKALTPSQPPTAVTALFNPMIGHISGAYTAQVSRNLSLSTRFEFNVYSYDSDWAMGAEWWLRRKPVRAAAETHEDDEATALAPSKPLEQSNEVLGVVKARASTNNVVALMWEGRLRNTLISLGFVSDFSSRSKPIKAIGLEVSYFSAG